MTAMSGEHLHGWCQGRASSDATPRASVPPTPGASPDLGAGTPPVDEATAGAAAAVRRKPPGPAATVVREADLPILVSLAHGHTWTTACDLAQLTPEQRRETARRLRLSIEPANGRVRNFGHFVAGLARGLVTAPCSEPACGQPQVGPGHPRKGWVKIHQGAAVNHWFCSWGCAAAFTARQVTR